MPKVTVIPATRDFHTGIEKTSFYKRRVAGYARVSTDEKEQLTSYKARIDYYTNYIKSRTDWEFVNVYTDEGISATNTKHRDGFKQMIEDALNGKIDLIVTKSVSRFARNTVDSLTAVRKLKDHGIEVFFEKENIYTFDSKGELLITIMSSLAQEESRSISENVTWGKRKYFADGKVYIPYKNFLGYKKGSDNLPEIVPEEAEIIRQIYTWYLEGRTPYSIAQELTSLGVKTPMQQSDTWSVSTIQSILKNEKYKGSALLQKRFTTDFLTKKTKVNEGEVPQYYIEDSHPAIISPEEFELVQAERQRRKYIGTSYSGNSLFASKLVCGECGAYFGPKVWHSNDKYRQIIYRCNGKYKKGETCKTPHLTEEGIKEAFIKAFNILTKDKENLLNDCRIMQETLTDTTELDGKIQTETAELEVVGEMIKKAVEENTRIEQDQREFWEKYDSLRDRYQRLSDDIYHLNFMKTKRAHQAEIIGAFMFELMERDGVVEAFDDKLWVASVDIVKVYEGGKLVFKFKNGAEIEA